ncbi:hypothetical protein KIPB_015252, partial [Kipferlia bialata]
GNWSLVSMGHSLYAFCGNKAYVYNTQTKKWVQKDSPPVSCTHGTACLIDPYTVILHSQRDMVVGVLPERRRETERLEREREVARERERTRESVDAERATQVSLLISLGVPPADIPPSPTPLDLSAYLQTVYSEVSAIKAALAEEQRLKGVLSEHFASFSPDDLQLISCAITITLCPPSPPLPQIS